MMNRRTIGWVVAIALGASGTALAEQDTKGSGQQGQRSTTTQQQQPSQPQERTSEERTRTFEQQTTERSTGAAAGQTSETSGTGATGAGSRTSGATGTEEAADFDTQQRAQSMKLEDRVEAVRLKALESEEAMEVQRKLQELGYYKGEIDGAIGPLTRGALQRYFRDQAQLVSRGMVGSAVLASFGIDESEIQRVRGLDEEGIEQGTESGTQPGMPSDSGTQPSMPEGSPRSPGQQTAPPVEPTEEHEHLQEPGTGDPGMTR